MSKTWVKVIVGAYVVYLLGSLGLGVWWVHEWSPNNVIKACDDNDGSDN